MTYTVVWYRGSVESSYSTNNVEDAEGFYTALAADLRNSWVACFGGGEYFSKGVAC